MKSPEDFQVDTVDTMNDAWKQADFSKYDAVFHVAGIAHVDPKPEMAPLYYKVNRDLTIEIAKWAKDHGVKQVILREMDGILFPQNKEYVDTVEVIRLFAKKYNKKVWITSLLTPFVWLGSFVLKPISKMFADSYYVKEMSDYGFDYQMVNFEDSLKDIEPRKTMR